VKISRLLIGAFLDALQAACGGNKGCSSPASFVPPTPKPASCPGFGALLRRHRRAAGLSQEALAERARISLHAISALERGYRRRPQRQTLALLSGALGLDGDERAEFQSAARGRLIIAG
jgi:DNA-binding XRE family transcriptional regulator